MSSLRAPPPLQMLPSSPAPFWPEAPKGATWRSHHGPRAGCASPSDLFFNHLMGFHPPKPKPWPPGPVSSTACQNCRCHFALVSQSSRPRPQGLRARANYPAAEPPSSCPSTPDPTEGPSTAGGRSWASSPSCCVAGSPSCCLTSILPSDLPLAQSQTEDVGTG